MRPETMMLPGISSMLSIATTRQPVLELLHALKTSPRTTALIASQSRNITQAGPGKLMSITSDHQHQVRLLPLLLGSRSQKRRNHSYDGVHESDTVWSDTGRVRTFQRQQRDLGTTPTSMHIRLS
jgi:hypothetical protein